MCQPHFTGCFGRTISIRRIYSSERLLEQLNDSVGVAMEQRSLDNAKEVQVRQQQLDVKTAIEANKRHGNDSGRSGSGGPGAWR